MRLGLCLGMARGIAKTSWDPVDGRISRGIGNRVGEPQFDWKRPRRRLPQPARFAPEGNSLHHRAATGPNPLADLR